jgi:hypothetical protein
VPLFHPVLPNVTNATPETYTAHASVALRAKEFDNARALSGIGQFAGSAPECTVSSRGDEVRSGCHAGFAQRSWRALLNFSLEPALKRWQLTAAMFEDMRAMPTVCGDDHPALYALPTLYDRAILPGPCEAFYRVREDAGVAIDLAPLRLRQIFPQELLLLLEAAGLELLARYGGFEKTPLTAASLNQVCIARLRGCGRRRPRRSRR